MKGLQPIFSKNEDKQYRNDGHVSMLDSIAQSTLNTQIHYQISVTHQYHHLSNDV